MKNEHEAMLTDSDWNLLSANCQVFRMGMNTPVFGGFHEDLVEVSCGVVSHGAKMVYDDGFPCEAVGSRSLHVGAIVVDGELVTA